MTFPPASPPVPRRTFPRWLIVLLVLGSLGTLAFCAILVVGVLTLLGGKVTPTVINAIDGKSHVTVPGTWHALTNLNGSAQLQVGNPLQEQYLIALTTNKADITDTDLASYSQQVATDLTSYLVNSTLSAPRSVTIHDRAAIQYEIHGTMKNVQVMYLLTCVDGTQNYYQVLAWTVESKANANRAILQQVSESFQEGSAAASTSTTRVIYDPQANASDAIAQALAQAKVDHKRVLLDFGADWCPDCQVLAQLFDDPQVKPFLDAHYHVVRIDVGQWDNNLDLANRYGNPIAKGIPAVVILDADARTITSTAGGELANARNATANEILSFLQQWAESS